jgi:site-specific DNA recombinase
MDIFAVRQQLKHANIREIPLRVTFYARVSTDSEEQALSNAHQIKYFTDKIAANPNWTLVEGYVDEGISGISTKSRISFQRMIEDAKAGRFDLIITKEISRFARNTVDSISYTRELLRNGVAVIFENDGINTIEEDCELRLTIMAGVAQDELRKLSSRVRFGHKQSIRQGHVLGTDNMYGYHKSGARLTVDEKTAPLVVKIFTLYASGNHSLSEIARLLGAEGLKNRNGGDLSTRTLRNILSNPKYKGYYVGGKVEIVDMFTKKQKFLPEEKWVTFKDDGSRIPALVSEELWERANAVLRSRSEHVKSHQGKINMQNLFTGVIRCAHCGGVYYKKENILRNGVRRTRWSCSTKLKGGRAACSSPDVYEEDLIEVIRALLLSDDLDVDRAASQYEALLLEQRNDGEAESRRAALQREVEKLSKQKTRLIRMNLDGAITDEELVEMMRENNALLSHCEEELQALPEPEAREADIHNLVADLRQALAAARGDVFRALDRRFVERYIDRIEVRAEGKDEMMVTVFPKFGGKAAARIGKNEVRTENIFLTM